MLNGILMKCEKIFNENYLKGLGGKQKVYLKIKKD